jgi:diguanylate cyclase (GGDEF)-like protein/PAS domain S-box-containing protein
MIQVKITPLHPSFMPLIRQKTSRLAGWVFHTPHALPIGLMTVLLLVAGWWMTVRLIEEDRTQVLVNTRSDLVNLGRLTQEHAERTLASVDQVLRVVQLQYREHGGQLDLKSMVDEGVIDSQVLHQVAVIDAKGLLQLSSLPFKGVVDLSDRAHFKAHLGASGNTLYISTPVLGRASGKWSIQVSRRITGVNGEFAGVVVASLDPSYFTHFYADVALGQDGVAAMYKLNGELLARKTPSAESFSGNASANPLFERVAQGEKSGLLTTRSTTDGAERLYHFKTLPSYPLLVTIGMSTTSIFADHLTNRARLFWQASAASVLLLAFAVVVGWALLARQRQVQAKQNALLQLQTLVNRAPGMTYQFLLRADGSTCFPFASEGVRSIFQVSPGQVEFDSEPVFASIHPDDLDEVRASIKQSAQSLLPWVHEFRVTRGNRSVHWLSGNAMPQRLEGGAVLWHGYIFDTTERHEQSMAILAGQSRLQATLDAVPDLLFEAGLDGRIHAIHSPKTELLLVAPQEMIGKLVSEILPPESTAVCMAALQEAHASGRSTGRQYALELPGGLMWFELSVARKTVVPGEETLFIAMARDITDRKRAEAEIQSLAFFDPLTRLPNRRLLADRLKKALAGSLRGHSVGALLFIDLDNFKNINDSHGHDQGDLLLQQAASRLQACVRDVDTVARLGGDEFVVMLQDLSDSLLDAATRAELVGEKVLAVLREPYHLTHALHHSSASVGVTLFDEASDSVDELLKRADLALYQAKAAGRNALRFYDPDMQAAVIYRAELEADLRHGLKASQFLLFYQPQVDDLGRLMGVESLVRWRHPLRGMVSPAQFIPLAEQTGLILPLGQWVMETACHQLTAWAADARTAHLTLAVNVSALEFHREHFVRDVLATLAHTGAPASKLKLELTEGLLVSDMEDIVAKMQSLKMQGVGFSLDDFGTGYSSLSYLKRLPLDQLKIDQSFLHEALTNPKDAAIVRATIGLGKSLGLMVIAEGVETQAQRDFLESEGCLHYQGYYFGRPGPVEELARFFPGQVQT